MLVISEAPTLSYCNQADSSTTSVTVSWQPAAGAVFYTWSYDSGSSTTTETSAVITGLETDKTLTFTVTAHGRNVTGNSVTCQAYTCTLPYKTKCSRKGRAGISKTVLKQTRLPGQYK